MTGLGQQLPNLRLLRRLLIPRPLSWLPAVLGEGEEEGVPTPWSHLFPEHCAKPQGDDRQVCNASSIPGASCRLLVALEQIT